jgi:type I restriction-modification system DNA methylase subunit
LTIQGLYKRRRTRCWKYAFRLRKNVEFRRENRPGRPGAKKRFFILPNELFCNVLTRADKDENLNETLERVFTHIESSAASGDAESDFAGLFDDFDTNSKPQIRQ